MIALPFRACNNFNGSVVSQFDEEAAEPVPILSGRRHVAIPPCVIAATPNCTATNGSFVVF